MARVVRSLSVPEEMDRWANQNNLSYSNIVQDYIKGRMSPTPNPTEDILKSVRTFFVVMVLGLAALLFGLIAPLGGGHPALSIVVALIGAMVTVLGITQYRWWHHKLTGKTG